MEFSFAKKKTNSNGYLEYPQHRHMAVASQRCEGLRDLLQRSLLTLHGKLAEVDELVLQVQLELVVTVFQRVCTASVNCLLPPAQFVLLFLSSPSVTTPCTSSKRQVLNLQSIISNVFVFNVPLTKILPSLCKRFTEVQNDFIIS